MNIYSLLEYVFKLLNTYSDDGLLHCYLQMCYWNFVTCDHKAVQFGWKYITFLQFADISSGYALE